MTETFCDPGLPEAKELSLNVRVKAVRFDGYDIAGSPHFSGYVDDGQLVTVAQPDWITPQVVDLTQNTAEVQFLREINELGLRRRDGGYIHRYKAGRWIVYMDYDTSALLTDIDEAMAYDPVSLDASDMSRFFFPPGVPV